ncbi:MAG: hypothetical protein ACD_23C00876G0001, partial [uncultured bacterium]
MLYPNAIGLKAKARPLLPSEPRISDHQKAQVLTERYLLPALSALEALFLEIRAHVDPVLKAARPINRGKRYPLGQCLEISLAVERHLCALNPATLSAMAATGHAALSAFFQAGGTMRRIWGDLRGKYFQNAFLVGALYVDVSNDTVVVTKPKVEILPFEASGLTPIADYAHFARIAEQYWEAQVWPNHVAPELAPFFPVLTVAKNGAMAFRDAGDYLMTMNWVKAFRPSQSFLSREPMTDEVFDKAATLLKSTPLKLATNPEQGRRLALQNARTYRDKRWHRQPTIQQRMLVLGYQANQAFAHGERQKEKPEIHRFKKTGTPMNILFIHQNFPGQFKFLAPALAQHGHAVMAMTMQKTDAHEWQGIKLVPYNATQGSTPSVHPWVSDFETKTIRGEACFRAALQMKAQGYMPDVVIAHHGWGESLFLKEVWPDAKLGIYCEFYYHPHGADVGFDPEFPAKEAGDVCRLRLKNLNNLLHFEVADAGISPTHWQASTFPEPFRSQITVVHDGIDTGAVAPNPNVSLTLNGNLTLTKQDEVITFVNRNLEPYRGYHVFMRVLPEILKRRPNARVLIVGGDDVSYGARPTLEEYGGQKWKDI